MSDHLKRMVAPASWRLAHKENRFVTKTRAGPHNGGALPMAVLLRDRMNLARTMKEVKLILSQRSVLVNGRPCRDPRMGVGIFDIVAIPKMDQYFRILLDKKGRIVTVPIDAEAAKTRLARVRNKTVMKGGRVQLNLDSGANVIGDHSVKSRDSVILSLEPDNRFEILDHFPFAVGNMAMVFAGRHAGRIGRITGIITVPGATPNRVTLEDANDGTPFETIDEYCYMVGRETPAIASWGIEA
ncbi:MAG TPA: 30S ribosomal protein S4e [Methanoregulaceae archaeon]|nr:30S ribosomal protein S4e [Methanoregulaceae archaeon]